MTAKKRKPAKKRRGGPEKLTAELMRTLIRAAQRANEFELDARDAHRMLRQLVRRLEQLERNLAATAGLVARARDSRPVNVVEAEDAPTQPPAGNVEAAQDALRRVRMLPAVLRRREAGNGMTAADEQAVQAFGDEWRDAARRTAALERLSEHCTAACPLARDGIHDVGCALGPLGALDVACQCGGTEHGGMCFEHRFECELCERIVPACFGGPDTELCDECDRFDRGFTVGPLS